MTSRVAIFVPLVTALILVGCGNDGPTKPQNTPPTASFTVTPNSGTTETDFVFDASGCSDMQDPDSSLVVRWDWEDDGAWDTKYDTDKTAPYRYSTTGTKTIKLEVKDTAGLMSSATRTLEVEEPTEQMVVIPAGSFTMGSDNRPWGSVERP